MRRHLLHISTELLIFAVGFLAATTFYNLTYALLVALVVFILLKIIPGLEIDLHFLCVAALSLVFWAAGAYAFLSVSALGYGGCCEPYISEEEVIGCPIYPQRVPQDTVITLERTGCYGRCPSYTLSIFADGTVVYYGNPRYGYTRVTGAVRGWISQEQLRQLVSEFERVNYFSLNDRYKSVRDGCPDVATDMPSAITSLQMNGRKKTIEHYYGCISESGGWNVFPQELTEVEREIDEAVNSELWVKLNASN